MNGFPNGPQSKLTLNMLSKFHANALRKHNMSVKTPEITGILFTSMSPKYRYILGLGYGASFVISFFRQHKEIEFKPTLNPIILTEHVLLTRHFDGVPTPSVQPRQMFERNWHPSTIHHIFSTSVVTSGYLSPILLQFLSDSHQAMLK